MRRRSATKRASARLPVSNSRSSRPVCRARVAQRKEYQMARLALGADQRGAEMRAIAGIRRRLIGGVDGGDGRDSAAEEGQPWPDPARGRRQAGGLPAVIRRCAARAGSPRRGAGGGRRGCRGGRTDAPRGGRARGGAERQRRRFAAAYPATLFRASRCTPCLSGPAGSTFSVTSSGLKCSCSLSLTCTWPTAWQIAESVPLRDLHRLLVAVHQVQLVEDLAARRGALQHLEHQPEQLAIAGLGRQHLALDQMREVLAGRQHLERDGGVDARSRRRFH